jgi:hypothetical protein
VSSPYSSLGRRRRRREFFLKKTHEIEEKKISIFSSTRHYYRARKCGSFCNTTIDAIRHNCCPFHSPIQFHPFVIMFHPSLSLFCSMSVTIPSSHFRPPTYVRHRSSPSTHHIFQTVHCVRTLEIMLCIATKFWGMGQHHVLG